MPESLWRAGCESAPHATPASDLSFISLSQPGNVPCIPVMERFSPLQPHFLRPSMRLLPPESVFNYSACLCSVSLTKPALPAIKNPKASLSVLHGCITAGVNQRRYDGCLSNVCAVNMHNLCRITLPKDVAAPLARSANSSYVNLITIIL